jgi:hypothetical protein
MRWEQSGRTSYPMHCGLIEWLTRHRLECPHINSFMGNLSFAGRVRIQSSLGNQKMEHGLEAAGIKRKMQLSELDEWHEKAYHNTKIYKERTKRWHDKRIKMSFTLGGKVLPFNSRVKLSVMENYEANGKDHSQ